MALPVARKVNDVPSLISTRGLAGQGQMGDALDLLSVSDATAILAPCGLLGVAEEIGAADARLTEMGLPESEALVQLKINGGFPAWFFFAAMRALGVHTVRLHEPE